jgi:hypothetical protein
MREAGRTAKADHLRRLMDRSRTKNALSTNQLSFSGFINSVGRWLWYAGLLGQIFWDIMALVAVVQHENPDTFAKFIQPSLNSLLEGSVQIAASDAWARSALFCTVSSIWWNPMFKQMNSGFMNHIKGFGDWYKLQFLLIVIRLLFYYVMGTGVFSDRFSSATTGAHIFFPCFVTLVSTSMKLQISLLT